MHLNLNLFFVTENSPNLCPIMSCVNVGLQWAGYEPMTLGAGKLKQRLLIVRLVDSLSRCSIDGYIAQLRLPTSSPFTYCRYLYIQCNCFLGAYSR